MMRRRIALAAAIATSSLLFAAQPMAQQQDAISAVARNAVTTMGQALATGGFSFHAVTLRQYEKDNLPLHIVHEMEVTVHRPDRLRVKIDGDDGQAEIGYDGSTLTVYSAAAKKYGTFAIKGTIETVLRTASEKKGIDFPLAELIADQPGRSFLEGVITGVKVGDATIGGTQVNHFFFIQPPGMELELWTEANAQALPRRLIVTYRSLPGEPQFVAEIGNWKLGLNPADDVFVVKPPADATKMEDQQ